MNQYKSILTFLAVLALLFIIIQNFSWDTSRGQEINYSDFLRYVDQNQIAQVSIQGNSIRGTTNDNQIFETTGSFLHSSILVDILREKNVTIQVEDEEGSSIFTQIFLQWGPLLLLIGVWIFFMRKMPGSGKIMSIGKSKAKKYDENLEKVTFKDVAGMDENKEELHEIIDFLSDPEKFQRLGGKIPKGVLMVGPPGTGKTLLAKAVAGEAGVAFFNISGSDFVEMFVGVGASRVRDLFAEGKKNSPCIIFIDEIDAVGRHRGAGVGGGNDEREQTLNQLLVEMDGFDTTEGIIIIAATNRVDILDPALLRPGRFDRQVHVALPDIKGRAAILEVHCKKIALAPDINIETIARGTPGFSGADLANLANEAALWAARQNKKHIELIDLEWARDKVMMGAERKSLVMTEDEKEATAYHEAGHALVSVYLKNSHPLHKVTIIPRGQALGVTSHLPEFDQVTWSKDALLNQILISMGGKAAEEIIFTDTTQGVEGDLKNATNIAYQMVCKLGMSEKLGTLTINSGGGSFMAMDYMHDDAISDDLLETIDTEVFSILNSAYDRAKNILNTHIDVLHKVAKLLLAEETISGEQVLELVKLEHQETQEVLPV